MRWQCVSVWELFQVCVCFCVAKEASICWMRNIQFFSISTYSQWNSSGLLALAAFDHSQHSGTPKVTFPYKFLCSSIEKLDSEVSSAEVNTKRFQGDSLGGTRDGVLEKNDCIQAFVQGAKKETFVHFHSFLICVFYRHTCIRLHSWFFQGLYF